MDIIKTRKPRSIKRFWYLPAGAVLSFFLYGAVAGMDSSEYRVERDKLLLAEVELGELEVKVRGPGILAPRDIRWISSDVEAMVERVVVKPGAAVQTGDLLVEMSNPQLQQRLEETRWELEAQQAQTEADGVQAESRLLDQEAMVLDAKLNYESAEMRLRAESELMRQGSGALSQLDFERSKLETTQFKQRWEIAQQQLAKARQNFKAQNTARAAALNKMRKTLQRIESQVEALQVRAQIDSVVQAVAVEPGQRVVLGGNIARLARQDDLIAELRIPELQIRDVELGQSVRIDTRNSVVEGRVSRIAPNVVDGSVMVDVEFDGQLPRDARPDLSVDGEIQVASLSNAVHVRRPIFAQSHKKTTVFRLSDDETEAEKITVDFGTGSTQRIEVISGLRAGDKIIVSDAQEFQRFNRIQIQ